MMPMDPKKLIHQFSWKRSLSAVISHLHKIQFADIMVGFHIIVNFLIRPYINLNTYILNGWISLSVSHSVSL